MFKVYFFRVAHPVKSFFLSDLSAYSLHYCCASLFKHLSRSLVFNVYFFTFAHPVKSFSNGSF